MSDEPETQNLYWFFLQLCRDNPVGTFWCAAPIAFAIGAAIGFASWATFMEPPVISKLLNPQKIEKVVYEPAYSGYAGKIEYVNSKLLQGTEEDGQATDHPIRNFNEHGVYVYETANNVIVYVKTAQEGTRIKYTAVNLQKR